MRGLTYQNFLDSLRQGNVKVEEEGEIWNVFDDKERGTMLSFPKAELETKEEAIKYAESLTVKHLNARKEHVKLNERLKCPFCYYEEKISIINRWSDTEDYFCSEGHNFSIVLHEVNKKN